jgi:hypothetical protein
MNDETRTILDKVSEDILRKEHLYKILVVNNDEVISTYEVQTQINNIYNLDTSAFLPNEDPMSLDKFITLTSNIIASAQDAESVEKENLIVLTEEYPPDEFHNIGNGNEVIAYKLIKREPANMNRKASGRPQRTFSHSYDLLNPNYPNKTIVVESRPVDHIIELACWAKSNKIANKRAIWLEKLLINNSWQYQTNGIERFHWEGRGTDTYTTTGEQRLFYRPLRFFVRFREFEAKLNSVIQNIEIINGGNYNG